MKTSQDSHLTRCRLLLKLERSFCLACDVTNRLKVLKLINSYLSHYLLRVEITLDERRPELHSYIGQVVFLVTADFQ